MAVKELSQITSGGNPVHATDQIIAVRNGTTDVLTNVSDIALLDSTNTYSAAQTYSSIQVPPYFVTGTNFVGGVFNIGLLNPIPQFFAFSGTTVPEGGTIKLPPVSSYLGPMYFIADITMGIHVISPFFVSSDGSNIIAPMNGSALVSSFENFFGLKSGGHSFLMTVSTGSLWQNFIDNTTGP